MANDPRSRENAVRVGGLLSRCSRVRPVKSDTAVGLTAANKPAPVRSAAKVATKRDRAPNIVFQ